MNCVIIMSNVCRKLKVGSILFPILTQMQDDSSKNNNRTVEVRICNLVMCLYSI